MKQLSNKIEEKLEILDRLSWEGADIQEYLDYIEYNCMLAAIEMSEEKIQQYTIQSLEELEKELF